MPYQLLYEKMTNNLSIGIADKDTTFALQLVLEGFGINQIPIMGYCNCSAFEVQNKGLTVFDFDPPDVE